MSASPMRPAALMRGASTKPICTDVTAFSDSPASCNSACRPMKSEWSIEASPRETSVRFSPDICMTSATVPTAASVQ